METKWTAYTACFVVLTTIVGSLLYNNTGNKPTTQNMTYASRFASIVQHSRKVEDGNNNKQIQRDLGINILKQRIGDESIAETLTRLQLKFKPGREFIKMPMSSTVDENPYPYNYPSIRYVEWKDLTFDTKQILGTGLGYTKSSWNYMNAEVESKKFDQLSIKAQQSLQMIGIENYVWDCFINHYSSYSRQELKNLGLDQYTNLLSKVSYQRWSELKENEKYAAKQLCFSEHTWDEDPLGTW